MIASAFPSPLRLNPFGRRTECQSGNCQTFSAERARGCEPEAEFVLRIKGDFLAAPRL